MQHYIAMRYTPGGESSAELGVRHRQAAPAGTACASCCTSTQPQCSASHMELTAHAMSNTANESGMTSNGSAWCQYGRGMSFFVRVFRDKSASTGSQRRVATVSGENAGETGSETACQAEPHGSPATSTRIQVFRRNATFLAARARFASHAVTVLRIRG